MASSFNPHICYRNVFIPPLVQRQSREIEAEHAVSAASRIACAQNPQDCLLHRRYRAPLTAAGVGALFVATARVPVVINVGETRQ